MKVRSEEVLHLSNKEIMERYGVSRFVVWKIRNGQEWFCPGYNQTEDSELKKLRISRGMSRKDLAERVGCSAKTIQNLELGTRNPSIKLAIKLAEVLICSIEAFTK